MDRRLFINLSTVLASTVAGCGGGDIPEFIPEKLDEFDASGPEIAKEDLTAAHLKGFVPGWVVPDNAIYQAEITYLTSKPILVSILPPSQYGMSPILLGRKSYTTGSNHALGFGLLRANINPLKCKIVFGVGNPRPVEPFVDIGVYGMNPYADCRVIDSAGNSCVEWTIYDPSMPVTGASVAVIIRFYQIPIDQIPALPSSFIAKSIFNNVMHQAGSGQVMVMHNIAPTTLSAPQHQSFVIRSAWNNLDTLMIPSDPIRRSGHYAMVPHLMGAGAELKPFLARYLARHGARLGTYSANVHGVLDNPVADTDQFHMLVNENTRILFGQGGIDHLNEVKTKLGTAIQTRPPVPTVGNGFNKIRESVLPLYPTALDAALQRAALASSQKSGAFDNQLKADNLPMGAGVTFAANAQAAVSYKSDTPGFIFGIPVQGAGIRFSVPLGSYSMFSTQEPLVPYYIGNKGQAKFSGVLIIKMFDAKVFMLGSLAIDLEITVNTTVQFPGLNVRVDSVNVELVADTDSKAWMGWIFQKILNGFTRSNSGGMPPNTTTNILAEGTNASTGGSLEMVARSVSDAAIPATMGGLPVQVVSQFDTSVVSALSYLSKSTEWNSWALLEGYIRIAFVNTSVASGTFQSGWNGFSAGFDIGARALAAGGVKATVKLGAGDVNCFVRVQVAADYHWFFGPPAYVETTKYLPHVA
ncbi:MAG: hypothetical protein Q8N13_02505 [Acidovorax sp.]|nr:hypothetical protein [Acidovorax sp.]